MSTLPAMSPSTQTPLEQLSEHAQAGNTSILLAAPQAVAFWSAIALPLAYMPLLYGGLNGSEALLLIGLVAANLVAFVLGHGHLSDAEHRSERTTA
jgi:hypothetical protein